MENERATKTNSKHSELRWQEQVALTLYGEAIHRPGDGGLGRATGPAGQRTGLPWS